MTRDRQDKPGFSHSPFKPLKGLSASVEPKSVPAVLPKPASPGEEDDGQELFAREMAWQNVRPLEGRGVAPAASPVTICPLSDQPDQRETSEFLAAVGNLDKTFHDEIPAEKLHPRARPRRMKQLERGELKPAGELDLHGLTRDEAVNRAGAYLAHAVRQGWPAVVIVTGKGLHSSEGPVLRRAIERLLGESGELILEWGEAPRRFGGAGAFVVFLRVK